MQSCTHTKGMTQDSVLPQPVRCSSFLFTYGRPCTQLAPPKRRSHVKCLKQDPISAQGSSSHSRVPHPA